MKQSFGLKYNVTKVYSIRFKFFLLMVFDLLLPNNCSMFSMACTNRKNAIIVLYKHISNMSRILHYRENSNNNWHPCNAQFCKPSSQKGKLLCCVLYKHKYSKKIKDTHIGWIRDLLKPKKDVLCFSWFFVRVHLADELLIKLLWQHAILRHSTWDKSCT